MDSTQTQHAREEKRDATTSLPGRKSTQTAIRNPIAVELNVRALGSAERRFSSQAFVAFLRGKLVAGEIEKSINSDRKKSHEDLRREAPRGRTECTYIH